MSKNFREFYRSPQLQKKRFAGATHTWQIYNEGYFAKHIVVIFKLFLVTALTDVLEVPFKQTNNIPPKQPTTKYKNMVQGVD